MVAASWGNGRHSNSLRVLYQNCGTKARQPSSCQIPAIETILLLPGPAYVKDADAGPTIGVL